jgi:hypothetical protein
MQTLLSKTIQTLIEVPDRQVVAYGYAPMMDDKERLTYIVWFEAGNLIRCGYVMDYRTEPYKTLVRTLEVYKHFNPELFTSNIKRWYENGLNKTLAMYFETFGTTLSVTPGGNIPELPDVTDFAPVVVDGITVH